MRKFFLISLMALTCSVMAWAEMPEPQPFAFDEGIAPAAQKAPVHRVKAEAAEQDVLLEYEGFSQHFTSLQAAFNALPENSTPATVTLMSNIHVDYEGSLLSVAKYQRVTLDLNGDSIFGSTTAPENSAVITNRGTLTIIDSQGTGFMSNRSENPDKSEIPSYGNYVINNYGTLTINGGTFYSYTPGAAAYPLNNMPGGIATINGGHLYNPAASAIRLFCSSTTLDNQVIVNGGLIEGFCAIWVQIANSNANKGTLDINGGEIRSRTNCYYYANNPNPDNKATCTLQDASGYMYTYGSVSNVKINITGGLINENFAVWNGGNINISGGRFNGWVYIANQDHLTLTGGIFDCTNFYGLNLAPGYVWKYIGSTENEDTSDDALYQVVPAGQAVINKDTLDANNNEYELKTIKEALEEGETLEGTIISIVGAGGAAAEAGDTVKVTVEAGDTVQVHGITGDKEGQLIVKDGATLVIGNGGLVSTNDTLTQIIVEAGGTVAVGTGGVNKQGDATPIEIQSDGEKSGVLLIDPNAPAEVAEALAKVVVYTRAYKDGSVEHWQHIASPVKGNMSITPLNIAPEDQLYTIMYGWNATAGAWELLENLPTIGGAKAFDKTGWTGTDLLTPFAAYDLINNSPSAAGGITYEFAGELVGNDDLTLNFQKSGFSLFGNSYTAPIDLNTFFEKIKNDMTTSLDLAESAIDPCVYVFNSLANRFESVNSLDLLLHQWGLPAAFTQIPPQQAFVMNLLKGNSAQSSISYATSVWNNPNANKNTPIMAPKRQTEATISSLLNISVSDGNTTDRVILVQDDQFSSEYDLGADAMKYMNGSFNLYANTAIGQLDKVATNDIENTELSFKAGNEISYTMTFNNVIGDYVLVDRANNNHIAIVEGDIYTFAAQPNATAEARFAIVPIAKMPTAIENTEVNSNVKGIYTIMGQYLGEDFDVLPAGVYVVDGVKIVK